MPLNVPYGVRDCVGESPIAGRPNLRHDWDMTDIDTDIEEFDRPNRRYRLERPLTGRWAAGVAHGLADDWGVPVWVIRLAFAVLAPIGGLGFMLYAIGWLFIPREGESDPLISQWIEQLQDRQAWLGAGLVAAAAIIVLSSLNIVNSGLIWAGALLVLGVLLYRGDLGSVPPSRSADTKQAVHLDEPEIPPFEYDVDAFNDGDDGAPAQPAVIEAPPGPPRPPRQPSYLGRLTLGAMLITIGIMVALDVSGVTNPTSRHYLAAPVLVIGIGLLVGGFFGRSRGLIVFGLLLAPVAMVGSLVDLPFDGEFGDIEVFATSPADLRPTYRLAAGDIYLDLRELELHGETVSVAADIGAGRIQVALPTAYEVEIDSGVRLGELVVLGRTSGGFNLSRLTTRPGEDGTIRLALDAGIGQVVVSDNVEFLDRFDLDGPRNVFRPASIDELQTGYFLSAGTLELDLSGIPPLATDTGLQTLVNATVGRGDLVVLLPAWLDVGIVARSDTGVLDILGSQSVGENLREEQTREGDDRIVLNLAVGQGSVVVRRP